MVQILMAFHLEAQSNAYIFKGGSTIGLQRWDNSASRQPLFRYHGAFCYESIGSEGSKVVYAQIGYHIRGSGLQFNLINNNGTPINRIINYGIEFHNLALDIGFKKLFHRRTANGFYAVGMRGEYTARSVFDIYQELAPFVRKWNYGISARVGAELPIKKVVHIGFELNVAPDLSRQVFVPATVRRIDPWTGQITNGFEQKVVNVSLELSLYLKLIHQIIYLEE